LNHNPGLLDQRPGENPKKPQLLPVSSKMASPFWLSSVWSKSDTLLAGEQLTATLCRQNVIYAARREFCATMKPEPSPADTLRRVIKVARFNGMIAVLPVASLCALVALVMGDLIGAIVGLLVAAAGWIEWHGAKLLQRGQARGIDWLVRSQLYLLSIILLYVMRQMLSYDPEYVRSLITPEMNQMFQSAGLNVQQVMPMVRTFFYTMYGSFALIALFYQGGLALYYKRRATKIRTALGKGGVV
jgi:hypothetical protein